LLLALEEKGIASLTYTPSNPREVMKVLRIPEDYSLEVIVPVGKAAEEKIKEPRLAIKETLFYNLWGNVFQKPL